MSASTESSTIALERTAAAVGAIVGVLVGCADGCEDGCEDGLELGTTDGDELIDGAYVGEGQ